MRNILLVLFAAALSGCEPSSPSMPSYATDVRPIMLAHCTRCHGAGGTLQGDPSNYPLGNPPPGYNPGPPGLCHFTSYEDQGDCGDGGAPANCRLGAHSCATFITLTLPIMPPPPATLNDWERDILTRWAKNPLP